MSFLETKSQDFQDKINNSPKEPGCYMYIDSSEKILYIGKAKIIRNRVKSYFINYKKLDIKIQNMLDQAVTINFLTVDSEVEALILETNLIKKYRPKYNSLMMDDKNYSYIKIEKPIDKIRDFPRIKIVRSKDDPKAEYFGPYPNTLPLKNILKRIRKLWPYVSCNRRLVQVSKDPIEVDTNNSSPCLYYHLGLCSAPCASLIGREDYLRNLSNIRKFLRGEKTEIVHELENEMAVLSKDFKYEEAAIVRDKINDIKYVTQSIKIDNDVDDVVVTELKQEARENALNQLIEELDFPKDKLYFHPGFKIECYDISNIQGTNAVGSMTVMVDGVLRKDLYRKFKIRMKNEPNDFAMLQEVLRRRFSHLPIGNFEPAELHEENIELEVSPAEVSEIFEQGSEQNPLSPPYANGEVVPAEGEDLSLIEPEKGDLSLVALAERDPSFSVKPDLIIIDGGKGQLASTYKIIKMLGLENEIPIIGLAKREEEIFKVQWQFNNDDWIDISTKRFKRILLTRKSEALFLVQRIRDEAHRFGITYHRKLRSKKMITG